jgi:RNA polymerase sigma factor (sigma-70 family)
MIDRLDPVRRARDVEDEPRREPTELVRRARGGSEDAFEELVRVFGPRVHRFLAVRLGDERDARDALQETLIAAWQGLPRLRSVDRFWPWLAGIAANKAADVVRRRPSSTNGHRPELAAEVVADAAADWGGALAVRQALDRLPDRWRDVLLLRLVLGLSEEETAAALGVRLGTVKSRTARARGRLLELLDEGGKR